MHRKIHPIHSIYIRQQTFIDYVLMHSQAKTTNYNCIVFWLCHSKLQDRKVINRHYLKKYLRVLRPLIFTLAVVNWCHNQNTGFSVIYSCSYLTFSNSQHVMQCQNVLTASCTVCLSLFNSRYTYFGAGADGVVSG